MLTSLVYCIYSASCSPFGNSVGSGISDSLHSRTHSLLNIQKAPKTPPPKGPITEPQAPNIPQGVILATSFQLWLFMYCLTMSISPVESMVPVKVKSLTLSVPVADI